MATTSTPLAAIALAQHSETPRVDLQTLAYSEDQVLGDWRLSAGGGRVVLSTHTPLPLAGAASLAMAEFAAGTLA